MSLKTHLQLALNAIGAAKDNKTKIVNSLGFGELQFFIHTNSDKVTTQDPPLRVLFFVLVSSIFFLGPAGFRSELELEN